jgi:cellulose synthase/poly-beta-1,6-N-acetylglucosamine synthase-like glycosyltransferase
MALVSVVVPFYNEEGNVPEMIRRTSEVLDRVVLERGDDYEIVTVNDGSRDGTDDRVAARSRVWWSSTSRAISDTRSRRPPAWRRRAAMRSSSWTATCKIRPN